MIYNRNVINAKISWATKRTLPIHSEVLLEEDTRDDIQHPVCPQPSMSTYGAVLTTSSCRQTVRRESVRSPGLSPSSSGSLTPCCRTRAPRLMAESSSPETTVSSATPTVIRTRHASSTSTSPVGSHSRLFARTESEINTYYDDVVI